MKKAKYSEHFLKELQKVPIVQVACEKSGVSRNTVYRWKREDDEFAKQFDEALAEGINYVNDMSESQLLQLIKDKSFSAVRFWLNKRHPAYREKLEVVNRHELAELTDEQKETIKQALRLTNTKQSDYE
jgi:predicted site-specific integrase-resolvase